MGETNVEGQQPPTKKSKPEPTVLEQEFDKEFSESLVSLKIARDINTKIKLPQSRYILSTVNIEILFQRNLIENKLNRQTVVWSKSFPALNKYNKSVHKLAMLIKPRFCVKKKMHTEIQFNPL